MFFFKRTWILNFDCNVLMTILYCRRFKWYFVHTKVMWRERKRERERYPVIFKACMLIINII